jgi:hypothetical protein
VGEPLSPYLSHRVRDIFLASYLSSLGFAETLIQETSDGRVRTCFDFAEAGQAIALSYFDLEFVVLIDGIEYKTSPRKIFLAFRDLRRKSLQAQAIG